jgi:hypothetical protein
MDGTWGGTITEVGGVVTGGTLTSSGSVAQIINVGEPGAEASWWMLQWIDLSIDLATGIASAGTVYCYDALVLGTPAGPVACGAPLLAGEPGSSWNLNAGDEGDGGAARDAANFDGTILRLFNDGEGVNSSGQNLTMVAQIVPVPAAVWLFGSALGLLGWVRRRVTV